MARRRSPDRGQGEAPSPLGVARTSYTPSVVARRPCSDVFGSRLSGPGEWRYLTHEQRWWPSRRHRLLVAHRAIVGRHPLRRDPPHLRPLGVERVGVVAAVVVAVLVKLWSTLRQRLVACPTGLEVRHGLLRTERFVWDQVLAVRVHHMHRSFFGRRRHLSYFQDYVVPEVFLTDGSSIKVRGLTTTSVLEGWSVNGIAGADERIRILIRYRASFCGPWPARDSSAPRRRTLPKWLR